MVVDAKMENNAEDLTTLSSKIFFITKTIELILAVLSLGLAVDPFSHIRETDVNHAGLAYVAYCGAIITSIVLLLSRAAREMTPVRASTLFSLVGGLLFLASGNDMLNFWREANIFIETEGAQLPRRWNLAMLQLRSAGQLSILVGVIYLLDALYTGISGPMTAKSTSALASYYAHIRK